MSREPNLDQIVTRWVDDGPEVAPERFVWAALDQVERTPQRGSWRVALENTPMFLKFGVPVLGAAAAIVLGVLLYGSLSPAPSGNSSQSPASVASPDPCAGDAVSFPVQGTLEVTWCPARGAERQVLSFTLDGPASMADAVNSGGGVLYLRPATPGDPSVLFAISGPDIAADWVAQLADTDAFEVSAPQQMEIAGGEATVVDVRLAEGTDAADAPPLVDSTDLPWRLSSGSVARVWILEGQGEAMAVVTNAPEADFADWADFVGGVVETLEWRSTP
jgi:hypothetical protein